MKDRTRLIAILTGAFKNRQRIPRYIDRGNIQTHPGARARDS